MTMEPTNGTGSEQKPPYEVIVSMDRETLRVNVGGNVKDIDVIMNMLSTALRYMDVQYRIAAGIKAQEELKRTRDLLSGLGGGFAR